MPNHEKNNNVHKAGPEKALAKLKNPPLSSAVVIRRGVADKAFLSTLIRRKIHEQVEKWRRRVAWDLRDNWLRMLEETKLKFDKQKGEGGSRCERMKTH